MASTIATDTIVPEVYSTYINQRSAELAKLVSSGVLTFDGALSALMAQGGNMVEIPSWEPLADNDANVSIDTYATESTPDNISAGRESAPKLSRNFSWAAADILDTLTGEDLMDAIGQKAAPRIARHLQATALSVLAGIIQHNIDTDSSDLVLDVSGASYSAGSTDFSATAAVLAMSKLGELEDDLGFVLMHPAVYAKAKINNFLDVVRDSVNPGFSSFHDLRVVKCNGLAVGGGVYDTVFCAPGFLKMGVGSPKVPVESFRDPSRGNGGGVETLHNRVEWIVHPSGHRYVGADTVGGPANTTLAAAASWDRIYSAQTCGFVALRTRES